jgi:hypothetical protein
MASNLIIANNIKATARYETVVAIANTYNGYIVSLGAISAQGLFTVTAPASVADDSMVMILHESLGYEAQNVSMADVTFSTGDNLRVVIPEVGDRVSIPVANVTATDTLAVGSYVVPNAGAMPMESLDNLAGTESLVYKAEKLFTHAGVSMVQLRCIRTQR